MAWAAMKRRAWSSGRMVRPNGPVGDQRSVRSDQESTSTWSPSLSGRRRASGGMGKRVAAIAPFGTRGAWREGEALDAPDDRVGHAAITITRLVLTRRHGA